MCTHAAHPGSQAVSSRRLAASTARLSAHQVLSMPVLQQHVFECEERELGPQRGRLTRREPGRTRAKRQASLEPSGS
eukprot:5033752-Prymnesium_polylepis.1